MSFEKRPQATATFQDSTPLDISEGRVTLDSGQAPYALADIDVPLLDEAILEDLDPYANQRVLITASAIGSWSPGDSGYGSGGYGEEAYGEGVESPEPVWTAEDERQFDLVLTGRTVSHDQRSVALELASDEAILQRYADVTDSIEAFDHQDSLRDVIDMVLAEAIPGAALQAGTVDADVTTYTDATNLIPNPRHVGTGASFITAGNASVINDTTWPGPQGGVTHNGSHLYTPTSADSYLSVMGATGSLLSAVTPGKTYIFSAEGSVRSTLSGSAVTTDTDAATGATMPRERALVVHTRVGSGSYSIWHSGQVPSTVQTGTTPGTRVSVKFTVPEGATEVFLRAYLGRTAGTISWAKFRLSEWDPRPGVEDQTAYFWGSTPDTDAYSYEWTGDPDDSSSRRVALIDRAPELLIWEAGVTAWDFLTPIVATSGYRLWCDEQRHWWLIDPAEYSIPGRVVAQISNTSQGTDTINSLSPLYATGVVLVYTWTDAQGVAQRRVDSAGTGPYVLRDEINRPFPGPGRAAARLAKLQMQGRTQDVTVGADYTVTPAMEIGISLPGTFDQIGTLQGVTWQLKTGLMDLTSAGLVETPPGAIDLLTGPIDALTGPIDGL